MSKRSTATRGLVLVAAAGLLAAALASSSGAAATLTKKKVKKIATNVATNVFNSNIGNHASRVSSTHVSSPVESAGNFLMASTTITAPASGFLVMNGIVGLDDSGTTNDTGSCLLELNGTDLDAEYPYTLDSVESDDEICSSHSVQQIAAGSHTVDFFISGWVTTSAMNDARVTALYVPYGPTGARP
jgi:hypothetical protein